MKKKFEIEAIKRFLKSAKFGKICVLSAGFLFLLFIIWFVGLFRTPAHFRTVEIIDDNQVSQYLTNNILPEFYNKSQLGEPFEMIFSEQGINDIVSRQLDGESLKRSGFSDISITFKKGRILLTAKTVYHEIDFIVTVVFKPRVNKKGLFNAGVSKIQAGTSRLPFAARLMRKKIIYELADSSAESDIVHYAGLLLSDNKMPPEFSFHHRNFRIEKIIVANQKLIVQFLPD